VWNSRPIGEAEKDLASWVRMVEAEPLKVKWELLPRE
jgi:hypothetical protein